VAKAYLLAWETGCKGLTVYVTGSREQVVLETKATKVKKDDGAPAEPAVTNGHYANGANGTNGANGAGGHDVMDPDYSGQIATRSSMVKRPRPATAAGRHLSQGHPPGHCVHHRQQRRAQRTFRGLHECGQGRHRSDGSQRGDGAADQPGAAHAGASLPPSERLRWVMDEMAGIGGGRPLGFGANRVRSLPDGIAQVLAEHLSELPRGAR
jgi:ribonucleoside-diphosphate reductase alpha chain